jgi:bisphosphoglycerate-dependent phosphoglycerate mutase family 1
VIGWEDVDLARDGVEEAKEAGRLLKAHGFEFDVVYTSWLSRAIQTAWLVLDELDSLWLPLIKVSLSRLSGNTECSCHHISTIKYLDLEAE